jgi:cobalt/nickel transport protein
MGNTPFPGAAGRRLRLAVAALAVAWCLPGTAGAHFLVVIPSDDVLTGVESAAVDVAVLFTHPMQQGPVMELAPPRQFGALGPGKKRDLRGLLKPGKLDGRTTYTCALKLTAPGDYAIYVEPAPYWESSEQKMIVQYAKVVVDYAGGAEGWDAMVGFPVEIQPLTRPFGLWTGNVFRGIVKKNGRPLPWAVVEVEYYNEHRQVRAPNDAFVTQVIKADGSGVFCYGLPRAGWWGFAAVAGGDQKMKAPDGQWVDVEQAGVMWVKAFDMK